MWHQERLQIESRPKGFVEITGMVRDVVSAADCEFGLCHLFLRHTSAALIICENADPAVLHDLAGFAERFAPEHDPAYTHTTEGPDDMPAHLRSIFTGVDLTIPVADSRLLLGTWQGIYMWEHRGHAHNREVVITLSGSTDR